MILFNVFYNSILIILIWLYFVCVDKIIYSSFNYWRIKHILLKWLIQTSHVQLFATPGTVACQVTLSLTISQSLPKFKSIALAMPSSHIILWYPLLLSIFSSIRDFSNFSNELAVHIRWPKSWNFSFSISLSNEYSRLISHKIDLFVYLFVAAKIAVYFNSVFIFCP